MKNKIASGLFWKLLELAGAQGVQFVVALVLARLMSPEEYGTIGLIMIFITIANVFVQSGFATALIQRPDIREEDYSSVFRISLLLAVPVWLLLYLGAPAVASYYDVPVLKPLLRVMGLVLFPGAVISVQTAYVSREMNFRQLFKATMAAVILSGAAAIFLAPGALVMAVACAVSIVIAFILLTRTDAYVFYRSGHTRQVVKHKSGTASVFVYLLRYLTSNASYRVNTVALCVFSCVLPFILGQFDDFNDMPMGFAVLSLNTPICTLISGDPDTEQGLRAMPGQVMRFCTQYCLFIFCANSMISGVYLICWQFRNGGVGYIELLTAVLFALQSSILSVALEWLRPLRRWKVETDLWHHPRKYLVPAVMMLIAGVISLYPIAVWVWLGAMIVEVSGFAFLKNTREINKEM